MKFVFFGTPERAVVTLNYLKESGYIPSLVVTAPDSKKGRGLKLTKSDVKMWAEEEHITVISPEKLDEAFKNEITSTEWGFFIVVGYGKVLPKWLLDTPKHGALNIHYSLLPLYRGATPVETQLLNGDRVVGVTIMLMDEQLDHGPILAQEEIPMPDPLPTNPKLVDILAHMGGKLLVETLPKWIEGTIEPKEQDHTQATFTRKFTKEEGKIDLSDDSWKNFCKIKAFEPWPRTYFFAEKNGKNIRVIITDAEYKDGELLIKKVIPEGEKETSYENFLSQVK